MSALDVMSGLWLDRKLTELENRRKNNNNNNIRGNDYVDYELERERKRERIQANYEWLDEVLKTPRMFGYLIETDKMGFFKALAKAKDMFRKLYAERDYKNMMSDDFGNLEVNAEFVEMIEEFYYKEVNPKAKIYDLKLARYNDLRDELIERFEGDEKALTEEYARNVLGVSRAEMFSKVKNNEVVFAFSKKSQVWFVDTIEHYSQYVAENKVLDNYPLAS